jgi:hypothetical protein
MLQPALALSMMTDGPVDGSPSCTAMVAQEGSAGWLPNAVLAAAL